MTNQPEGLISVLLDTCASISERDDAAMDLGEYTDNKVVEALVKVGSSEQENYNILASCGESLAQIWSQMGIIDNTVIDKLSEVAKAELIANFDAIKSEKSTSK